MEPKLFSNLVFSAMNQAVAWPTAVRSTLYLNATLVIILAKNRNRTVAAALLRTLPDSDHYLRHAVMGRATLAHFAQQWLVSKIDTIRSLVRIPYRCWAGNA